MSDLLLDTSDDLVIENNELVLVTGAAAIAQHIKIRLQFGLGEFPVDTGIGIPYFTEILGKGRLATRIRSIFLQAIDETPGVSEINSLELSEVGADRVLNVTFSATSDTGEIITFDERFVIV